MKAKCPADGYTKRQYAKELLERLEAETPKCKERMFAAILRGNLEGWPEPDLNPRYNSKNKDGEC